MASNALAADRRHIEANAEHDLGMLWQVREIEALFRPLELDEIAVQLDLVFTKLLDGKAQEYGCLAGVATIHQADMFRPVLQDVVRVRDGFRAHVRVDAAVRALESDLLVIVEQESLISVQCYCHVRSLLLVLTRSARSVCTKPPFPPARLNITYQSLRRLSRRPAPRRAATA